MGIEEWVRVASIADGHRLAEPIFQRRYRQSAPTFPLHVVAQCLTVEGHWQPACYIHFTDAGDHLLGGGACVDDRVLRRLPDAARAAIHAAGGLYPLTLRWSIEHFAARYAAVFGYCGDVLAERADLAVGFQKTEHKHLLVYFTRPLDSAARAALIAKAHAIGPF